jgi:hypothetical protein
VSAEEVQAAARLRVSDLDSSTHLADGAAHLPACGATAIWHAGESNVSEHLVDVTCAECRDLGEVTPRPTASSRSGRATVDDPNGAGFGGVTTNLSGYAVTVQNPGAGLFEWVLLVLLILGVASGFLLFIAVHSAPLVAILHQHHHHHHRRNDTDA